METKLALVFLAVPIVNAGLSCLSLFLDKIKDLTKTDADNKLAERVRKAAEISQKIVDFLSANRKH